MKNGQRRDKKKTGKRLKDEQQYAKHNYTVIQKKIKIPAHKMYIVVEMPIL